MLIRSLRSCAIAGLALAATLSTAPLAHAETTLRAVMQSDLKILDPIWTTAYIVRNYGYMVYDTLFAMDAKGEIQREMVDKYSVSDDQLTWTLRCATAFYSMTARRLPRMTASLRSSAGARGMRWARPL